MPQLFEMITRRCALSGAAIAVALAMSMPTNSNAADYPTKPVKIITPYNPAGSPDIIARLLAEKLTEHYQQPFLVENVPGAGGIIGVEEASRAEPDGYTLMLGALGTMTILPNIRKSTPFEISEFAPISMLGGFDLMIVTSPANKGLTFQKIIEMGKKDPGALKIAHSGLGSEHHLLIEQFNLLYGANLTPVAYKGFGKGVVDILADRVDLGMSSITGAKSYIDDGKLGPVAVTGPERSPDLPDTPTFTELGYSEIVLTSWMGLFAPAGAPAEIVDELGKVVSDIVTRPEFVSAIKGMTTVKTGPEAFAAQIKADTDRWAQVIKDAKIPLVE